MARRADGQDKKFDDVDAEMHRGVVYEHHDDVEVPVNTPLTNRRTVQRPTVVTSVPPAPSPPSAPPTANPAPLGLCAFALTTFLLSCANAGIYKGSGIVLGCAYFYGGLVQLIAGLIEFKLGNVFGATVFSSYGAFWLSFAFTVFNASTTIANERAVGYYLMAWALYTGLMFVAAFATNLMLVVLLGLVEVTFILLSDGALNDSPSSTKAGGYVGIAAASLAWYGAMAAFFDALQHPIRLPVFPLKFKRAAP